MGEFADLSTLDRAIRQPRPNAKPPKRKALKGRKDRAEAKVKTSVRAACVQRDGFCRCVTVKEGGKDRWMVRTGDCMAVGPAVDVWGGHCDGPAEWAHMHAKRRSQTRNQAPEKRHDTAHSLMLCKFHHQEYDAHRLIITALTRKGANGPLKFRRAK